MRVACVLVPSFFVAVARRVAPALRGEPLVVYQRNAVVDASAEAGRVRPGTTLRQAKALCPQAMFIEANQALCREVAESLLDALESVTPVVEPAGLGCAYADLSGLGGHYRDEFALAGALVEAVRSATGLLACAGIANGKFAAWVAGSSTPPGDAGVVLPGREQEFLQDKDVALLLLRSAPAGGGQAGQAPAAEVVRQLELLALRTLGDVAALPLPAVEAQFGSAGGRLWELANGIDRAPVRARKRQEALSARLSFEAPVVATEALLTAGRQLIARLVRRLHGRTARRMHVQLLADERIVWERLETFREPAGGESRMLLLLKTRLSFLELSQAVDTVAITLTGIGQETGKQAKLFTDTQQNLNQIAESIQQLRARYGRPVVWRIAEVDPWSRHPEERRVLVPYDG